MLTDKRIAFVLYNYPLGVSTMLINVISMLKEHRNEVIAITNILFMKRGKLCVDFIRRTGLS